MVCLVSLMLLRLEIMNKMKYIIITLLLLGGCKSVPEDKGGELHYLLYFEDTFAYKSITKEDYLPPKEFN